MATVDRFAISMERSPAAFKDLGEEALRTHILVSLNGVYEGATAESFNLAGKTDILVRVEDRNIFIAECKIWRGQKDLLAAIDQLQSYATWRDTKTALVIFSRNQNFSAVLEEIRTSVPSHPNYKRTDRAVSTSHQRYVFKQPQDDSREMILAVTAFDVPK